MRIKDSEWHWAIERLLNHRMHFLSYDPPIHRMNVSLLILGDTPVRLWGLSAQERIQRVLKRVGVTHVVANLSDVPEGNTVLMVRAEYVYDNRVLHNLVKAVARTHAPSDRTDSSGCSCAAGMGGAGPSGLMWRNRND